jgi:hypothetical protein
MGDEARKEANFHREQVLCKVRPEVLEKLYELEPSLTKVQSRVLRYLAERATPPHWRCSASSRGLAKSTGCSRSNIKEALRKLNQRKLITSDEGTATIPQSHLLNFMQTLRMGGPNFRSTPPTPLDPISGPPLDPISGPPLDPISGPPLGPISGPPLDPISGPPPVENMEFNLEPELPRARVSIDSLKSDIDEKIDRPSERFQGKTLDPVERALEARPKHFSRQELDKARAALHGHAVKFPSLGYEHRHPPDDQVCAEFLSIADWSRLESVLFDLMVERKQAGGSYGWFVAVAMQRIHGIKPENLKARREELKLVKQAPKKLAAMKGMP